MATRYEGWWFWIVVILAIIFWDDIWHSKWAYSVRFSVPPDHVWLENKPHQCDFWKAPIGEKECHYNRVVSTIEWAKSAPGNTPIVSYDDGKTWSSFTPDPGVQVPQSPTVKSVSVSWEKIED